MGSQPVGVSTLEPAAQNTHFTAVSEPWWKSAVVYQIYPRSFCDTTGNGIGDLEGIRRHLQHLTWLGVDAIWLSPIFRSPMADHGYDVSDYCDVDPLFGSLADCDRLIAEAHQAGLRVLLDWVPNHTSDRHPWFIDSRSSRQSSKRDWYHWVDGEPAIPPTEWTAAFPAGPAWQWDEPTRQWYLHRFTPQQPDLNWSNPEVVAAMHDTLRFWLDRGVDGFRMDVIHMIGTDPARLRPGFDGPTDPARTHAHLRDIRRTLSSYDGERLSVGEVYILDPGEVATYLGDGDELHLAFNFVPLWTPWNAEDFRREIARALEAFSGERWPVWTLSNHDMPRHRTRIGRAAAARAAAVLLLTLKGTAFLYAGEELGLEDAVVPAEAAQDPLGLRDGCRAPIPWEPPPRCGWTASQPWLPWPPGAEGNNAAALRGDDTSILHLYRKLLELRRRSAALSLGEQEMLPAAEGIVAWRRYRDEERVAVVVNFTDEPRRYALDESYTVALASDGKGEGSAFDGSLASDQALVLALE